MKRLLPLIVLMVIAGCSGPGEKGGREDSSMLLSYDDSTIIMQKFMLTQEAWNEGNIEGFMQGYHNSDRLVFVGSRGPTYGYNATLDNYRRGYPDTIAMGKLKFDLIDLYRIDCSTAIMIGRFYLKRSVGDQQGYFTLVWQKIDNEWVIISDHSSGGAVSE